MKLLLGLAGLLMPVVAGAVTKESFVKRLGAVKTLEGASHVCEKALKSNKMKANPFLSMVCLKVLNNKSKSSLAPMLFEPLLKDEGTLNSLSRPKLAVLAVVAVAGYTVAYEWLFKPWGKKLQQWIAAKRKQKETEKEQAAKPQVA